MNDIFDITNILLFAVAVLIFFRLRNVLGRRTGNERPAPRLDPYAADAGRGRDNVVTLPGVGQAAKTNAEPPQINAEDRIRPVAVGSKAYDPLQRIARSDTSFDTASFLKGARAAYEMIVTAYAHGDRDTLRNLLSKEVFEGFNSVITERESRKETTEFGFVGISSADITDANLASKEAHLTVRFVSQLVTAVRDSVGMVIEGDVKAIREVTDIWTFARDIGSSNPNWRLVATDAP